MASPYLEREAEIVAKARKLRNHRDAVLTAYAAGAFTHCPIKQEAARRELLRRAHIVKRETEDAA